jgi:hypothetical protein
MAFFESIDMPPIGKVFRIASARGWSIGFAPDYSAYLFGPLADSGHPFGACSLCHTGEDLRETVSEWAPFLYVEAARCPEAPGLPPLSKQKR